MVSDELENSRSKNLKTFPLCCRGEISAASAIASQAEKKCNRKIARGRRDSGDYRQYDHINLTFLFARYISMYNKFFMWCFTSKVIFFVECFTFQEVTRQGQAVKEEYAESQVF
jgi:hypothetical protein